MPLQAVSDDSVQVGAQEEFRCFVLRESAKGNDLKIRRKMKRKVSVEALTGKKV